MSYEHFSDNNSVASLKESTIPSAKPEDILTRPRIDIETLKKSEKRLQDMLDTPMVGVTVEPTPSTSRTKFPEVVVNDIPIVIQSIDKLKDGDDDSEDEDEFGERLKTRKKSVVTFNENVEKIIHVQDTPDESVDFEVFKL